MERQRRSSVSFLIDIVDLGPQTSDLASKKNLASPRVHVHPLSSMILAIIIPITILIRRQLQLQQMRTSCR
jgi:hypothetical protein